MSSEPVTVAPTVTVVGAGPTGALAAILLAKRGYRVRVFEYREDPRGHPSQGSDIGVFDQATFTLSALHFDNAAFFGAWPA